MAKHIFKGSGAPTFAPRQVGHHYVDLVSGDQYLSKGTATPTDWVLLTPSIDDKVKISAADTTSGYLNSELTVDNGINSTNPLEKSIVNPGADEKLNIRLDQTKLAILASQVTDFNEAAQDAVGGILTDSSSVDFTYNDSTNTITASVLYGTPTTLIPDGGNIAGTANTAARSDHTHDVPTAVASTNNVDQANAEGSSASFARADHIHNIPTATPTDIGSDNYAGSATTTVKSDHVHKGVHSLAKTTGDTTQLFGDITLEEGSGITITRNSNKLTFSTQASSAKSQVAYEDFLFDAYAGGGSNDNPYSFQTTSNAGSSDIETTATGNDYMGMHVLSTLASASSRPLLESFGGFNKLILGGLDFSYEIRVRMPTLSDGTNTYTVRFGLMDGIAAGQPANGVIFSYTNGTNSGRWRGSTIASSTATNVDSTITVTANTWYRVKIIVNAAGSNVDFYIDDVLIGSATTNIPTAALRLVAKIEKSAGTTARTANIDYFAWSRSR